MKRIQLLTLATVLTALLFTLVLSQTASALDDEHWHQADLSVSKAITYLRSTQNKDGSWTPQPGPAITAIAVRVMLMQPDIDASDPAVAKGLEYILSKVKPDGGIHDGFLQNYNTAICLSALALVNDVPRIAEVIANAQKYLRTLQWTDTPGSPDLLGSPDTSGSPGSRSADRDNLFFGGAGYGQHGRPDMSNTQIMLEGLYDSGLDCNDPAFQNALLFITRCQGTPANDKLRDVIKPDGGFIYATTTDKDNLDKPESKAGMVEVIIDGQKRMRLATYGSMTYAGFKSYIYADMNRNDPRVVDAYQWVKRNFTVEHNPGMPEPVKMQGHYYYLMTMSRALDAWGTSTLTLPDGKSIDWANALIAKLVSMQAEDGSWANPADRWMEGDPNLVTGYALVALQHAMR